MGGVVSFFSALGELTRDIYSLTPGAREKEFYREVFNNCKLRVGRSSDPLLPIVLKRQDREYGYDLVVHVPPGLSAISFVKKKVECDRLWNTCLDGLEVNTNDCLVAHLVAEMQLKM